MYQIKISPQLLKDNCPLVSSVPYLSFIIKLLGLIIFYCRKLNCLFNNFLVLSEKIK